MRLKRWAAWIRWSIVPACSSFVRSRTSRRPMGHNPDVNLRGTFLVMRQAMPHLKAPDGADRQRRLGRRQARLSAPRRLLRIEIRGRRADPGGGR